MDHRILGQTDHCALLAAYTLITEFPCRMQNLGGIGNSDAQQQATIEATLRLKELSTEEAQIQGAIVIGLRFTIWEPVQAVREPWP